MNIALKQYVDEATRVLSRSHPEWDSDKIHKIISEIVEERCQNPTMKRENNIRHEYGTSSLLGIIDWIHETKPIIAGNGTFYSQPDIERSPTAVFLKDLKNRRAEVKRSLFDHEPESMEYVLLDLESNNIKVIMNANYGAAANKAAAFHDDYSPAAITLMAQSIITTMAAFFEGFCGDNHRFFHINDCFDWIHRVIDKNDSIDQWIRIPTSSEVSSRIISKFQQIGPREVRLIKNYVQNISDRERVYLFYADNFRDVVRHSVVKDLIVKIMSKLPVLRAGEVPEGSGYGSTSDWNKYVSRVMFLNPYNIPEDIKEELSELQSIVMKYVFVEYLSPDSIEKLNNHERNTVLLVDTDSNGIYLGQIVDFMNQEILHGETFGREGLYNDIIIVSIMTSMMSIGTGRILDYYGRCHNIGEEGRKELSMKNEFLWTVFFVMFVKKHYAALVAMREGNISIPFRLDIKGMDFIKAGVSEEVGRRFTRLLTDYILLPPEPQLRPLMVEIRKFEREIREDVNKGGVKYLKSQQYKPIQAYSVKENAKGEQVSVAWTQMVYRGSEVWNLLNEEQRIQALDRVFIVKTIIEKLEDVDDLKERYPDVYWKIVDRVYGNPEPRIAKTGLSVICLPPSVKQIPEWLLPYVNVDLVVSDTISSFRSVLETFGIAQVSFKTPNKGEVKKISGLISM